MPRRIPVAPRRGRPIADLNGDGRQDIVVASSADGGFDGIVTVELAQPGGGYAAAGTYPTNGSVRQVHVADVSGDGRLDVVVAGLFEITLLDGRPDGEFVRAFRRGSTGDVGVGDLDGDGEPEVAWSDGSYGVYVASAEPDGSHAIAEYRVNGLTDGVRVRDWTGDGRPDLLVADAYGEGSWVMAGTPTGLAPAVESNITPSEGGWLQDDFDGDGDIDMAEVDRYRGYRLFVDRAGRSDLGYEEYWPGGRIFHGPVAGDFDGDGRTDLAVLVSVGSGGLRLRVLPGLPSGRFGAATDHDVGDAWDFSLVSGDLDGDGRPDLVVADGTGRSIKVWRNRTPIVALSPPAHTAPQSLELPYTARFLSAVRDIRIEVKRPGAAEYELLDSVSPQAEGRVPIHSFDEDGEWRFRVTAYGHDDRVLDTAEATADVEWPTTIAYRLETIGPQPVAVRSQPKPIRLVNDGDATLRVRGVDLDGDDFAIVRDECSGKRFAPGAGCDVYVVFTPAREGERSATLTADGNFPALPLHLRGVGYTVALNPAPTPEAPPAPAAKPAVVPPAPELLFDARPGPRTTRLDHLRVAHLAAGSTVTVRCSRGCSRSSLTRRDAKGTVSLASLARNRLKAGTIIRVTIAEPRKPTVVVTLKIRAGRAPSVVSGAR